MTLQQLKYVLEIAKAGSINQAANNLFLSQSVLSVSIKTLEEELGQKIFSRSNKGVQPTPFGNTLISYITPIYLQLQQLDNVLYSPNRGRFASLSVATTGFYFADKIYAHLLKRYHSLGIRITSYDASLEETMQMLYNQTVNLGVVRRWSCYDSINEKQLRSLKLHFFPIAILDVGVTVGPNNPLYHLESNYVTTDMLKDYPCAAYCYLDTGPYADIYTKLHIPESSERILTESRATIYEVINSSDAYYLDSVTSAQGGPAKKNLPDPQRTLILSDCDIKSEYGWIKRRDSALSPIEEEFIEMTSRFLLEKQPN